MRPHDMAPRADRRSDVALGDPRSAIAQRGRSRRGRRWASGRLFLALAAIALAGLAAALLWDSGRDVAVARVGHPQSGWAAPGSAPLSDAQAAALVTRRPEQRPENAGANAYVASASELHALYAARNSAGQTALAWNPLLARVSAHPGLTRASTDDLIQWVAHKWGIPEDVIRAQLTLESRWRMRQLGDRHGVSGSFYRQYPRAARVAGTHDVYESMGIAQIKWIPDGSVGAGTEPLRWRSTAFDLDFYGATLRYYYDGYCGWCGPGYARGQAWRSVGAWFSPNPWGNPGAEEYVRAVRRLLAQRAWE